MKTILPLLFIGLSLTACMATNPTRRLHNAVTLPRTVYLGDADDGFGGSLGYNAGSTWSDGGTPAGGNSLMAGIHYQEKTIAAGVSLYNSNANISVDDTNAWGSQIFANWKFRRTDSWSLSLQLQSSHAQNQTQDSETSKAARCTLGLYLDPDCWTPAGNSRVMNTVEDFGLLLPNDFRLSEKNRLVVTPGIYYIDWRSTNEAGGLPTITAKRRGLQYALLFHFAHYLESGNFWQLGAGLLGQPDFSRVEKRYKLEPSADLRFAF